MSHIIGAGTVILHDISQVRLRLVNKRYRDLINTRDRLVTELCDLDLAQANTQHALQKAEQAIREIEDGVFAEVFGHG